MWSFNRELFLKEVEKVQRGFTSELINNIINYDGVLPAVFDSLFNHSLNFEDIPLNLIEEFQSNQGDKLIEHIRYESFKENSESWSDCDNRLINLFNESIGGGLFQKRERKRRVKPNHHFHGAP